MPDNCLYRLHHYNSVDSVSIMFTVCSGVSHPDMDMDWQQRVNWISSSLRLYYEQYVTPLGGPSIQKREDGHDSCVREWPTTTGSGLRNWFYNVNLGIQRAVTKTKQLAIVATTVVCYVSHRLLQSQAKMSPINGNYLRQSKQRCKSIVFRRQTDTNQPVLHPYEIYNDLCYCVINENYSSPTIWHKGWPLNYYDVENRWHARKTKRIQLLKVVKKMTGW